MIKPASQIATGTLEGTGSVRSSVKHRILARQRCAALLVPTGDDTGRQDCGLHRRAHRPGSLQRAGGDLAGRFDHGAGDGRAGGYLLLRDVNRDVRLAETRAQFVASVSHE